MNSHTSTIVISIIVYAAATTCEFAVDKLELPCVYTPPVSFLPFHRFTRASSCASYQC